MGTSAGFIAQCLTCIMHRDRKVSSVNVRVSVQTWIPYKVHKHGYSAKFRDMDKIQSTQIWIQYKVYRHGYSTKYTNMDKIQSAQIWIQYKVHKHG